MKALIAMLAATALSGCAVYPVPVHSQYPAPHVVVRPYVSPGVYVPPAHHYRPRPPMHRHYR